MNDKRAVQRHVNAYLAAHRLSVAELARRTGIPGGTLGRMLRDDPHYRGNRECWRQLAGYTPLGLSEPVVLRALGFDAAGSDDSATEDPFALLKRAMTALALDEESQDHLRRQVRLLARLNRSGPTLVQ